MDTIVLTGASSGLGESLSYKLSSQGYKIVLAARSEKKLVNISKNIKKRGGESIVVPTDVSNPDDINNLKYESLKFGKISILINNAGFGKFNKIEELSLQDWDNHLNINLRSAFLLSKAFIPSMKKLNKGSLIFINSVAGKKGYSNSSAYVASKFGMKGLADSLREELRENNIKVISIHPGATNTPFWDSLNVDFPREEMLAVNTLAESILFLIQAPGNFTVEEIVVRRTGGDF